MSHLTFIAYVFVASQLFATTLLGMQAPKPAVYVPQYLQNAVNSNSLKSHLDVYQKAQAVKEFGAKGMSEQAAKGRVEAAQDIAKGSLIRRSMPLPNPPYWNKYARLLRERGIEFSTVSPMSTVDHNYNLAMQEEIERRFGAGIMDKLLEEARSGKSPNPIRGKPLTVKKTNWYFGMKGSVVSNPKFGQVLSVLSVNAGGPAQQAGLEAGDQIYSVDGIPIGGSGQQLQGFAQDSAHKTPIALALQVVNVRNGELVPSTMYPSAQSLVPIPKPGTALTPFMTQTVEGVKGLRTEAGYIKTEEEWLKFWEHCQFAQAAPLVDFKRHWICVLTSNSNNKNQILVTDVEAGVGLRSTLIGYQPAASSTVRFYLISPKSGDPKRFNLPYDMKVQPKGQPAVETNSGKSVNAIGMQSGTAVSPSTKPSSGQPLAYPLVIAHRGASGYLPEHTLEAASMAFAMKADYIEQDVVLTKDLVPVVLHDIHLDTVTDVVKKFPGRARDDDRFYAIDFTLDEIKQLSVHERIDLETGKAVYPQRFPTENKQFRVPTLVEEIELIQGLNASSNRDVGIYVEVKSPDWHRKQGKDISPIVISVLKKYGYEKKEDKVFLQCFDPVETRRFREELGSNLKLVQLIGDNSWNEADTDFDQMRTEEGLKQIAEYADGIGPWMKHVLETVESSSGKFRPKRTKLVKMAHASNLYVHVYTLRQDSLPKYSKSFERLVTIMKSTSVDGMFTDFPDLVLREFNEDRERSESYKSEQEMSRRLKESFAKRYAGYFNSDAPFPVAKLKRGESTELHLEWREKGPGGRLPVMTILKTGQPRDKTVTWHNPQDNPLFDDATDLLKFESDGLTVEHDPSVLHRGGVRSFTISASSDAKVGTHSITAKIIDAFTNGERLNADIRIVVEE